MKNVNAFMNGYFETEEPQQPERSAGRSLLHIDVSVRDTELFFELASIAKEMAFKLSEAGDYSGIKRIEELLDKAE